ncbi:hypothetical protein DEO72_LG11g1487 [Vigna unguiculata]|uniref:Transmembrane protein n=1 Tax=Vigna unguiculata TaxID=3917 RepID=A0A4D6NLG8_VIGUN|nr:hypothetical protein DEO72_LG11g1487 [Vigna unguiculata]
MKRSEKVEVGEGKEDEKGGVGRGLVDGAEEGAIIIIVKLEKFFIFICFACALMTVEVPNVGKWYAITTRYMKIKW